MDNAKLFVMKEGQTWRAIILGTSSLYNNLPARLVVKGQPRKGWTKAEAIKAALVNFRTSEEVQKYADGKPGQHMPKARLAAATLEPVVFAPSVWTRPARAAVEALKSPIAPVPSNTSVPKDEIAELIHRRREALKIIAEIDTLLSARMGPELSEAVHAGMAKRLN